MSPDSLDFSFSGLKTAVSLYVDRWRRSQEGQTKIKISDIAASFQATAIDILVDRTLKAARHTNLQRIVVGGGVAANSYLRRRLSDQTDFEVIFPSLRLCTDNAAMVAGLGYHLLARGDRSGLDLNASARIKGLRRSYP